MATIYSDSPIKSLLDKINKKAAEGGTLPLTTEEKLAKAQAERDQIAREGLEIDYANLGLAEEELAISKTGFGLDALDRLTGLEENAQGIQNNIDSLQLENTAIDSDIGMMNRWLGDYDEYRAGEMLSARNAAEAEAASGREAYEGFLDAIGYADAAAGASGRVGAGTSTAAVTGKIDSKLVEFAGADRALESFDAIQGQMYDAQGNWNASFNPEGTYAKTMASRAMGIAGLARDLESERLEVEGNLANKETQQTYNDTAIETLTGAKAKAQESYGELETFIAQQMYDYLPENMVPDGVKAVKTATDTYDAANTAWETANQRAMSARQTYDSIQSDWFKSPMEKNAAYERMRAAQERADYLKADLDKLGARPGSKPA